MFPLKDENPTTRLPIVTVAIIIACVAAYFGPQGALTDEAEAIDFSFEYAAIPCEISTGEPLSEREFAATVEGGDSTACDTNDSASPLRFEDKSPYLGVLTSIFLHGGLLHLLGNMWFLWIFGNNIEDRLGHVWFSAFYLAGGVVATLAHYLVQSQSTVPVVGASGAIAAIMGAYLVWFPDAPVKTFIFFSLRDVSAKWFLGFWFVTQFFVGSNSGIAWMAHVGGFVFGALIGLAVRQSGFGEQKVNPAGDPLEWDTTGGVGQGPLRHPFDKRRNQSGYF